MATCMHGATIRFRGEVTAVDGSLFRSYEAPDGCGTDIRVRKGPRGPRGLTSRQARAEAVRRLNTRWGFAPPWKRGR